MSSNLQSGMARAIVNVTDLSQFGGKGLGPITAVIGVTERGPLLTPTLIRNWPEYERVFGRVLTDYDFPLLCQRALQGGATLLITRIFSGISSTDAEASVTKTFSAKSILFKANSPGEWGNFLTIRKLDPRSSDASKCDLQVSYSLQPSLGYTYFDFPLEPVASDVEAFNRASFLLRIEDMDTGIELGAINDLLEDGVIDLSALGVNDVVSALEALDGEVFTRLVMFENYGGVPYNEAAYYAYLSANSVKKDIMFVYPSLKDEDDATALAIRNCTAPFDDNLPIDDWQVRLLFGGIKIKHPVTGLDHIISVIGDWVGIRSTVDVNQYPWISEAGQARGRIKGSTGVYYNLYPASRKFSADRADRNGISMTIDHPDFGTVLWGNSTLHKADTLLKHGNVAELVLYVKLRLKTIIDTELFNPNDIQTWRSIHRAVVAEMEFIKTNRGLYGYTYEGDQNVDDVADAVYNTPESIANGEYRFTLSLQPTAALKYVVADVFVTTTAVTATVG